VRNAVTVSPSWSLLREPERCMSTRTEWPNHRMQAADYALQFIVTQASGAPDAERSVENIT